MKELLTRHFFPFVIKPGRYAGGELGQIVKDPTGRLRYLHAYPDKYELGQSYPGLQMLYHIVNRDDRFLCERVFAVDRDAETIMREKNIPLFSLESWSPAKEFDAFGFTLVDETVYTNVLQMLDLAGIPVRSADRDDTHPIILAGGPSVYNPEPLAHFIDVFFIGDGEEGLPELLALLLELRGTPRAAKLEAIVRRIPSAYVPCFYNDQGEPTNPAAPARVSARVIRELKPGYYPDAPLVPLIETVHTHLGVEIMRGCPQGCRFCLAGSIYRPVRLRPQNDIINQVETQIGNTGYEDVGLMSLSATDYPEIEPLAVTLARRLEPLRVGINLPSLRPGSVSPALLDAVKRVRKSGLTIAPEAGTERLRLFIRKNFPDAAIYDTARLAFAKGWTTIKLYFMIGLPSETEEDLTGIANICRAVAGVSHEFPGRRSINVTLSPFVPKAHTPFQWDGVISEDVVDQKIGFIKRQTRMGNVSFKINNPRLSMLQAILGRGGRELAPAIEDAWRNGCRFDGWTEDFRFDTWMEMFRRHGLDIAESLKPIPFSRRLPWSHIDKGLSTEHLMAERQRTSLTLREFTPHTIAEPTEESTESGVEFGRGKKKVPSRNLAAPTKNRVRLRWRKTERFRFMSHLDNLRLIERAIRRSRMPIAYSQGFNPSMKVSFGPPLSLGFTSETEFVDITLEVNVMPYMLDSLKRVMPPGFDIVESRIVLGAGASLSSMLNRVVYTIPAGNWPDTASLARRAAALMQTTSLEIDRPTKDGSKRLDIRPAIYDLRVENDQLVMLLGLGEGGFARPTEIAELLSEGLTCPVSALTFHRQEMYRLESDGRTVAGMEI
jgi:radical SAM family uncharacterized protein/radical SAM-linked protein